MEKSTAWDRTIRVSRAAEVQELVAHVPLFGSIRPESLERILEQTNARLVEDASRQFISRQGQEVTDVSIIMEGWVMRYDLLADGRRQILEFDTSGDTVVLFGSSATHHQYFVQAITPVRRWMLDAKSFAAAARKEPELHRRLTLLAFAALSEREDVVTDLGRRSATERIARLILRLLARMDRAGSSKGHRYDFPFKQSHIADATGLTAVHVNRTLMSFRKSNAVHIDNGVLTVGDINVLLLLAEMTMAEFRALKRKSPA